MRREAIWRSLICDCRARDLARSAYATAGSYAACWAPAIRCGLIHRKKPIHAEPVGVDQWLPLRVRTA